MNKDNQVGNVLPWPAIELLRNAAAIEPQIEPGESRTRKYAVLSAVERVMAMYPDYFRRDYFQFDGDRQFRRATLHNLAPHQLDVVNSLMEG